MKKKIAIMAGERTTGTETKDSTTDIISCLDEN